MSTLAQIEEVVDELTVEDRLRLRRLLDEKLAVEKSSWTWHSSGWPVAPPDVPMEELKRIHALIEKEFSRLDP